MGSFGLIFVPPRLDALSSLDQALEVILVQALVPQFAVRALDEAVLDGPSGPNEVELDALPAGPLIQRQTHEFRAVVHQEA
jgi:hypothetical protein